MLLWAGTYAISSLVLPPLAYSRSKRTSHSRQLPIDMSLALIRCWLVWWSRWFTTLLESAYKLLIVLIELELQLSLAELDVHGLNVSNQQYIEEVLLVNHVLQGLLELPQTQRLQSNLEQSYLSWLDSIIIQLYYIYAQLYVFRNS
jgi:hypothetical protein